MKRRNSDEQLERFAFKAVFFAFWGAFCIVFFVLVIVYSWLILGSKVDWRISMWISFCIPQSGQVSQVSRQVHGCYQLIWFWSAEWCHLCSKKKKNAKKNPEISFKEIYIYMFFLFFFNSQHSCIYYSSVFYFKVGFGLHLFCQLNILAFVFPLDQPQHTPHLWQAAVAAAARQPQLLEGQPSSRQEQSASPVTFCIIPAWPSILFCFPNPRN